MGDIKSLEVMIFVDVGKGPIKTKLKWIGGHKQDFIDTVTETLLSLLEDETVFENK